jgi:hypothetical protein
LSPNRDNEITTRQRRRISESRTTYDYELTQLIREEENVQRLKFERQQWFEHIINHSTPASPRFIANFRMQQKLNKFLINSTMVDEKLSCTICLEDFQLNDPYGKWPCPSKTSHLFHYDCMLNTLRTKNTCPMCRHPVEAMQLQIPQDVISQFFTRLVL